MIRIIIFDFNRTLYNPEVDRLIPEAKRVLKTLQRRGVRLFLVSRQEPLRTNRIQALGLVPYFQNIYLTSQKSRKLFRRIANESETAPTEIAVVGDRVSDEIRLANLEGMISIHFKRGLFAEELPATALEEPLYTITTLRELLQIAVR